MIRRKLPGAHRIVHIASALGLLDVVVRYPLGDRITIDVPLYRASNRWDARDLREYDPPTVARLAHAIASFPEPVVFIDCGADIGIMSLLVAADTANIERFIGFEPNGSAYELLKENYRRLPCPAEAVLGAVGRAAGRGELKSPDYDPHVEHAQFIELTEDGAIPVYRVDDLPIGPDKYIALKIDVEGAELDTIEGAAQTLAGARRFVVDVEAHPRVAGRTGIDPIVYLRRLHEIRPCRFHICERPDVELSLQRDFFDQVERINHDVVAVSE